ncbi:uncharacterized protein LOC108210871 [Daucus carota subsp. sativus]|uniref:uncharacterized protein LOC108210871 n=1 Tax=Daucus carota subsp. sativus TaxID=79200 RepID=UPI0007EFF8B9|nr:PREDICTED: uncharacterized protein LOC108210871 [Daucus carota subsp. sativus]XP_017237807.1 PREDICTED: uncharacterized protein LOC108210871 [Daucus carota subsp. sativus]XP_017237808.1 PREDICTED: uncharacterized protein LOC108210871 [Daucus carota subsp. sativus]
MAIDMRSSDSSDLITSPRISFSYDLCQIEDCQLPVSDSTYRRDSTLVDSNHDHFNFSFSEIVDNQASSADELFFDGLLRPLQPGEKYSSRKTTSLPPLPPSTNECSSKEITTNVVESEQKHHSKSFWRGRRSNSVQCDNSHKKSSFWSLPLLLRSNSTGSVTHSQRHVSKDIQKQSSRKQPKHTSSSRYTYELSQKPPSKKNNRGSYSGGAYISPVLDMPPPYIGKGTAFNLFGFGYLFRNKKEKKNNPKYEETV